ncbi:MAG: DNA primase [Actinomycetota bacterium]
MSPGGRIKDSDVETVRERTDIVQLISEYVPLKKSGREFRGPCPFHQEKDPSFYVNPAKGVYFCFGCKESGGVFNFVMKAEGLNFAEAVERLADRIGYQVSFEASTEEELKGRQEKDRLYKLNQTASEYYHHILTESEHGKAALEYVIGRGFSAEIIEEFNLGFAPPGWDNLVNFLTRKGFTERDMLTVGVVRERSGGGRPDERRVYDIFRNRVIFPILDHRGRVVAFGGRRMETEEKSDEPKYLNSPETPIYRKGHTLYGYYQARSSMQDSREAILVEGYTDLLALRQAGIPEVAATLGTALTANHFDLLGRICDSVFLAFDADRAGREAARRALEFWGRFQMEVMVVNLPEGEDPASLVENGGAEAFLSAKAAAEPLLEYAVRRIIEGSDTATPMGRRRAMQACVPVLSRVSTDDMRPVRNELVRSIADRLEMPTETAEVFLREATSQAPGRSSFETGEKAPAMWDKVEREALRVLVHSPDAVLDHMYLDSDYFSDLDNKKILEMLKEFPACDEEVLQAEFDAFLVRMVEGVEDSDLRGKVTRLLMEPPPECGAGYEDGVFNTLKLIFLKREKRRLEREIARVDKGLEPRKYESLCTQLLEIQQVIRDVYPYEDG